MPPARPADRRHRGPRWWLIAVLCGVAACGSAAPPDSPAGPALVYLSGLDDHLLPAHDTVPLHRAPAGPVTAYAPVETLAWAYAESGGWVEISLAEGEGEGKPLRGWVADFHLRGELHLVDPGRPGCPVAVTHVPSLPAHDHHLAPSTRVGLQDLTVHVATDWVLVEPVGTGTSWWVDRRMLSERPGPDIRRAPPGTPCEQVQPGPVQPHTH